MNKHFQIDLENQSDVSQGEVRVQNEFDKIEKEIRQKKTSQKDQRYSKGRTGADDKDPVKVIEYEKFEQYLNSMQTVNNHNLAVATNYMMQLQQMQIDLQKEQENSYKALKRAEHLERKYEISTKRLQETIDRFRQERDEALAVNSKLAYEKQIHDDVIAEKDNLINNKNTLIEQLEDNIKIKEEELQNLRADNHALMEKNKELNELNKQLQLSIGSATYQVDVLEKQVKRDNQLFDEFKNNMRLEMKQKENQLIIETKLRQQIEKETVNLVDKISHLEDKILSVQTQNERLEHENKKNKEKIQAYDEGYKSYFKQEIQDIYEKNVAKSNSLENQLEDQRAKNADLQRELNILQFQIKQAEASRSYYMKESEDAEVAIQMVKQEKTNYLDEFRKLKEQYEKTISDLQNQLKESQMHIFKQTEDSKSLRMHLDAYEDRITYLLEIQEIMSHSTDSNMYKFISDLKTQGVNNFSKEEFQQIKDQALREHDLTLAKRDAMFKEHQSKRNIEETLNQDYEKHKNAYNKQSDLDSEWNKIFHKLNNIQVKSDNQSKLQQLY
ncbi:hypothetical protein ABPG74_002849 [Tetrahymena malaccensis]